MWAHFKASAFQAAPVAASSAKRAKLTPKDPRLHGSSETIGYCTLCEIEHDWSLYTIRGCLDFTDPVTRSRNCNYVAISSLEFYEPDAVCESVPAAQSDRSKSTMLNREVACSYLTSNDEICFTMWYSVTGEASLRHSDGQSKQLKRCFPKPPTTPPPAHLRLVSNSVQLRLPNAPVKPVLGIPLVQGLTQSRPAHLSQSVSQDEDPILVSDPPSGFSEEEGEKEEEEEEEE